MGTWGENGDQKAAKCNTGRLRESMVSVMYGFRLEYFYTLMAFFISFVAVFVCI